ncbi:NADPH:quinone oxidoreductase family protein [Streptomyces sp. DSM 44917]|uniref:NADPH:quinone oxidoreductase family protein n=1 Tax=Streptomyces boetiae TaxID=3075541 RepID=A0ABU2L2V3_9ACTN|nr:NADPH:quinone oxidoreductase family protein [Streptomyces sp. DSM 44917]MDT0305896.1 NADPH:quinone oxidoreductase family protein [Streptomyces sp. DSM 44917]
MRAIHISSLDGPKAAQVVETGAPEPGPGQVLIDVHVAGVSFPDVLLSRGEYQIKPEPPFVPGAEVAGVVRSAPADSSFAPGDRVAAFPAFGGFAEQVATDPRLVFPLPDGLSFEAGAALPMNYLTVHFGLVRRGRLRAGETVLVHGAAGGVGTAGIQLARALGARVLAVVSTPEKGEVAKEAGAHEAVLAEGFRQSVADLTDGRGVDLVLDPVGGDRFTDSLRSLATEGRLLVVGFTGREIPTVKVNRLLLNNIDVVGVSWGGFWMPRPEYLREQWNDLLPHLASGALDPVLGAQYPLESTPDALRDLDERRATGKILIRLR